MVKFIDTDYVFHYTAIDKNVDTALISATIISTQNVYVRQLLGDALYTKIIEQIDAGTMEQRFVVLLNEYVNYYLVQQVYSDLLPFLNYRFTNKNVKEEGSTGLDVIRYIRADIKVKAEFQKNRVCDFLEENNKNYPEYKSSKPNQLSASNKIISPIVFRKS